VSVLFLSAAAVVCGQNTRITWIGQACFYVQTENGPTVVTDPPVAAIGYALPAAAADAVTISHNHTDHNNAAGVRGSHTVVDGRPTTERAEMTVTGVPFVLIPGFHDATSGSARGRNTIVQWTQGGLRFAHFGDYGQASLTDAQAADLRNLDVLMIPAGGFFTIDAAQAAAVVEQLRPRVALLMHFRTALGGPAQLAGHPEVLNPFPKIRYKPASVVLARTSLPDSPEVWVMEPAADSLVVNAAAGPGGAPVAPGSLATAWGSFTGSATAEYSEFPLPRRLGETELAIGNESVPLVYVSPIQVNFQVPSRLAPGQYAYEVRVGGARVSRGTLTAVARAPGLFVAVDLQGRVNRAARGAVLTIYGSGQGAVSDSPADGVAAPADPLSRTTADPTVLVGARRAAVSFSGLTPGFAGLWQINAQIPQDAPAGEQVELVVLFDPNLPSAPLKIAVE
jgi:uncharacterized protein (TIGR03437 family)